MENKNDMFKNPKDGKPKMFRFNLYWMYGLIFIMLIALYMTNDSSGTKEVGWTEFQKLAQENVFEKMTVYNKKNLVEATVKSDKTRAVFKDMDVSKIGAFLDMGLEKDLLLSRFKSHAAEHLFARRKLL